MIQGFYFAKPMPKDEYEGRMRESKTEDPGEKAEENEDINEE